MNDIINGLAGRCFFSNLEMPVNVPFICFVGGVVEVFQPNNPMVRHHFPIELAMNWGMPYNMLPATWRNPARNYEMLIEIC